MAAILRLAATLAWVAASAAVAAEDPVAGRAKAQACAVCHTGAPSNYATMASIWVNDPRFTKNIDKAKPGLAAYSYAAVEALVKAGGIHP